MSMMTVAVVVMAVRMGLSGSRGMIVVMIMSVRVAVMRVKMGRSVVKNADVG